MGIFAIILAIVAWFGSAAVVWVEAGWLFGIIELVLITAGLLTVSLTYCSHCPLHKKGCVHGFLGIPAKLVKDRSEEPYKAWNYIVVISALVPMIGFPQFWLIQMLPAFIGYWLLFAVAGILIPTRVCTKCSNKNCPMNRNSME